MIKVRGYNFSRPFYGERVPQHIQNIVIRDFCKNNHLNFLMSVTEYTMENSFLILNDIIEDFRSVDGIVAYSMFQMPSNDKHRLKIFHNILKKKKKIYFACENLRITNKEELKRIENIWFIKKQSNISEK